MSRQNIINVVPMNFSISIISLSPLQLNVFTTKPLSMVFLVLLISPNRKCSLCFQTAFHVRKDIVDSWIILYLPLLVIEYGSISQKTKGWSENGFKIVDYCMRKYQTDCIETERKKSIMYLLNHRYPRFYPPKRYFVIFLLLQFASSLLDSSASQHIWQLKVENVEKSNSIREFMNNKW